MSTQTLHDGRLQLEAWGLAEFVREFQDLVKDGWYVDLTCNDSYPVNIGGLCHAKLVQTNTEEFVEDDATSYEKDQELKNKVLETFEKLSSEENSSVFSKENALKHFAPEKSDTIESLKQDEPVKKPGRKAKD